MEVGFFRRLFSSDFRAAVAAEAAGDLELAAERYALAGNREATARVHLARAERAKTRNDEIDALRDAVHWAPVEGDWRRRACRALGEALLSRARAEGITTERDRDRVREAARLLEEAGEHRAAGEAYEALGDDRLAARAFRGGGLVEKMEDAMSRDEARADSERAVREAYADYEIAMRGGDRDGAATALRRCVEHAGKKTEYRRLLDELESRLITGGRVVLRVRRGRQLTVASGAPISLGRDPLCDLPLRSGGVSRRHAEVDVEPGTARWVLRDAGSRNGTRMGGLAIAGTVPLLGEGAFSLGDECEVGFRCDDRRLTLRIDRGLDQGALLIAVGGGDPIALEADAELPLTLFFREGRPIVVQRSTGLTLNGERIAHGNVQLVHGDVITLADVELDVA